MDRAENQGEDLLKDISTAVSIGLDQALRRDLLDGEEVFEELERRLDRRRKDAKTRRP